jgi:hypothetical protein
VRNLWEPPEQPPVRPAGVPEQPSTAGWLEYRSDVKQGTAVWVWWDGQWHPQAWVRARARDQHGWWLYVRWTRVAWVHEARTAPWAVDPAVVARWGHAQPD